MRLGGGSLVKVVSFQRLTDPVQATFVVVVVVSLTGSHCLDQVGFELIEIVCLRLPLELKPWLGSFYCQSDTNLDTPGERDPQLKNLST